MEERPRIKVKSTYYDKFVEYAGWLSCLIMWVVAIWYFPGLPYEIPSHYNAAGVPDDYSGRGIIFFLPAIGTFLFISISILIRYPHIFNYPVEITSENAEKQYSLAVRLLRYLKLILVLIFLFIELRTILIAKDVAEGLGKVFLPVVLAFLFIPLVIVILRARSES